MLRSACGQRIRPSSGNNRATQLLIRTPALNSLSARQCVWYNPLQHPELLQRQPASAGKVVFPKGDVAMSNDRQLPSETETVRRLQIGTLFAGNPGYRASSCSTSLMVTMKCNS